MKIKKFAYLRITGALLAAVIFAVNAPFVVFAKDKPTPDLFINDSFPVLEIKLDGYHEVDIERSDWKPMTCRLTEGGKVFETTAQIKGRGNYTWAQSKRPYAIKLDEKQSWFGFGSAKDWVLLANYTDETHLRNFYAFTLASGFGFAFTPKVRHAQVFINGRYIGLYLITEKNEIDDKRLDIDVTKGDVLVELDNNYGSGEPDVIVSTMGNVFVIKDPDSEEFKEKAGAANTSVTFAKAKRFVKTRINNFETGLIEGAPLDQLDKYIDIDSLVDWYIFNEIMKNDDSVFNSSIFLNSRYEDKLYMGPVWDYDIALAGIDRFNNLDPSGLEFLENPWERSGNWFIFLAERDDFVELVKARWRELYSSTLFADSMTELDRTYDLLVTQKPYDSDLWNDAGVFVKKANYAGAVEFLKNFIDSRIEWLNGVWGDENATPGATPADPTPAGQTPADDPTPGQENSPGPAAEPDKTPDQTGDREGGFNPLFVIVPAAGALAAAGAVVAAVAAVKRRRRRV